MSVPMRRFYLLLLALDVVAALVVLLKSDSSLAWSWANGAGLAMLIVGVVCVSILSLRLRIHVDDSLYRVQVWPLPPASKIPIGEIQAAYPRAVSPLREFGGWGIRMKRGEVLDSLGGKNAVTVEYSRKGKDRKLTVTTEQADELLAALSVSA